MPDRPSIAMNKPNKIKPDSTAGRATDAVERAVRSLGMFRRGDAVLVGASGGPDSMALLHVLMKLRADFGFRLGVAHLNHCLRPGAADRDASFIEALSGRLGLPCFVERIDVRKHRREHGLSLEEAARRVRYDFFKRAATRHGFDKVALGHHGDDNAELVLMNLFRGSGPAGVSGMPAVRPLGRGSVAVVRPLLGVSRSRIMAYLAEENIAFVTDESNLDEKYTRNRIRHRLMPELKASYNPKIADALNRFARILRAENDWIEEIIEPLFQRALLPCDEPGVALSIPRLRELHAAARGRVLRKALASVKGDLRRITFSHVDDVIALIETGPRNGRLSLPEGLRVAREGEVVRIVKTGKNERARPDSTHAGFHGRPLFRERRVPKPGRSPVSIKIEEIDLELKFSALRPTEAPDFREAGSTTGFFDMDALSFPLILRPVRPGDRFQPLGMTGVKKVKKYFIDSGIPASRRGRAPLLVSGGAVVWIAGLRQNHASRVTPSTRNLLKVELFLA